MSWLKPIMDLLNRVVLIFGVTIVASMMVLTCVDVFLRYAFNNPFYGTVEVTQYLLALLVFAGLALITRDRSHIVVSLFEPFMLRHLPRLYALLFSICNLVGIAVIAWLLIKSGIELLRLDQRSLVLELPQGWLLIILGVLSAIGVAFGLEVFRSKPEELDTYHQSQRDSDL